MMRQAKSFYITSVTSMDHVSDMAEQKTTRIITLGARISRPYPSFDLKQFMDMYFPLGLTHATFSRYGY